MKNPERLIPVLPDSYTEHLVTSFHKSKPSTFNNIRIYEHDLGLEIHWKKAICILAAVGFILAYSQTLTSSALWLAFAITVFCMGAAYQLLGSSKALVSLRRSTVLLWMRTTVNAAKPVVRPHLLDSEDDVNNHNEFEKACREFGLLLTTKAEELARRISLDQFERQMEDFLKTDLTVKERLKDCFRFAEKLNPDTQTYA